MAGFIGTRVSVEKDGNLVEDQADFFFRDEATPAGRINAQRRWSRLVLLGHVATKTK